MSLRKIIQIDESKCNGCGLCVPNCAEGALKIVDGKARVVKDSFCDGLGACLGYCPQDALKIIEREADDFDEKEALKHTARQQNTVNAQERTRHGGCPGSRMRVLGEEDTNTGKRSQTDAGDIEIKIKPQLRQWPVQLNLVPVNAPWFENADLLVTADCVPFAYADYHLELLKGRIVLVGCPKLDDLEHYEDKLTRIFEENNIKSITVAHMEVPCCSGIVRAVETALMNSGKQIPLERVRVGINGQTTKL